MGVSKFTIDGIAQIDLSQDTVSVENLYAGESAVDASGDKIFGEAQADNEDALLEKTISSVYSNSSITAVRSYAFHRQYGLTKAILPNVTAIRIQGFYYCTGLEQISAPKALTSGNYAFYQNTALKSVNLPSLNSAGSSCFSGCSALTLLSLPSVTEMATWACQSCVNLETFDAPMVANLRDKCFINCKKLVNLNIPYTIHCGDNVFNGCSSLSYFVHDIDALYTANFYNCISLLAVDCGPRLNIMRPSVFSGCSKFSIFIIRKASRVSLDSVNAFDKTAFASTGSGGKLYVPQATISAYQSATNWSTILGYANNQILSIEGSEYENYYVDGTPINS